MAFVELEVKEHIGVLTINRPEALNALNDEVIRQLDQVLDSLDLSVLRLNLDFVLELSAAQVITLALAIFVYRRVEI